jgi:hypothetical protein
MTQTRRLFKIISLSILIAAVASCGGASSTEIASPGEESALALCLKAGGMSSEKYAGLPLQVQTSFCQGVASKELIGCYVYASLIVGGFPKFDDAGEADYKAKVCDSNFRSEMRRADQRAAVLGLSDTRGKFIDLWDAGGSDTEDKIRYVLERVADLLQETPRQD